MLHRASIAKWVRHRSTRVSAQESKVRYSTVTSLKRTTLLDLRKKYTDKKPLVLVTSYSSSDTSLIERSDCVDAILVGDSVGMVSLGHRDTTPVTMEDMIHHCKAATSTAKKLFVIGDMPFGSYEASDEDAVRNAVRLVKEGRVDAIKLEGGLRMAGRARAIVNAGMAVMGHIGLTPQSQSTLGGFKIQGKTTEDALRLIEDAKALEKAGCFAIVIEGVPEHVADAITAQVSVPTIGIGAGAKTSGQILVFHDMFGLFNDFTPKFAKRFSNVGEMIVGGLRQYATEVMSRAFPASEHTYIVKEETKAELTSKLAPQNSAASIVLPRRKIAIIGGGALGSLFAAHLSSVPKMDVWMISDWEDHVSAINTTGLELRAPNGTRVFKNIRATSHPREFSHSPSSGGGPLAIITAKSYQTEKAAEKAKEASVRFTLTLQNGMGNREKIASRLGALNVLQGVTSVGATMIGPGCVAGSIEGETSIGIPQEHEISPALNSPEQLAALGELQNAAIESANLFSEAGITTVAVENMKEKIWLKLIANSIINPLTAMLKVTNGQLLEMIENDNRLNAFVHAMVKECVDIAVCRGAKLTEQECFSTVTTILLKTALNKSSMLQDVLRGAPTELDAITGALLEEAIQTPIRPDANLVVDAVMTEASFSPGIHNLNVLYDFFPPVMPCK